jgi:hypothetical protein
MPSDRSVPRTPTDPRSFMTISRITGALWLLVAYPSWVALAWLSLIFMSVPGLLCPAGAAIAAFYARHQQARWFLALFAALAALPHVLAMALALNDHTIPSWINLLTVTLAAWSVFLASLPSARFQAPSNGS